MSQLGSVGVGLSVAFALFMFVLAVELYYAWTTRQKRREAESTQVKQVQLNTPWRHMIAASWSIFGAKEFKHWAKLRRRSTAQASVGVVGGVLEAQGKAVEDSTEQEDDDEEDDVFRVGGLWGPPRLLFTIKEETTEEMELEAEVGSAAAGKGKGSRHASRASGELLFAASSASSPFVTPPSSPPFATPFGSPTAPLPLLSSKFIQDVESSSSSTSSSSPPLGRRPLCGLFEDTSSFSSSSSAATPGARSPSVPLASSMSSVLRQHHPLCLLLDPPPVQSSALYHHHNRVHPHPHPHPHTSPPPPPPYHHLHSYGNPLSKPLERPLLPFSSFQLPAPSQPTMSWPFRASLNSKSMGFLISAPTFHLEEV